MRPWVIFLFVIITLPACGQPDGGQEIMLDRIADELFATSEGDYSYGELYETLAHLLANPVDVNRVTLEQLRAMMMLSESELNAFMTYRESVGPFLSTLELQAIPGWSTATVGRIQPFVKVIDASESLDKSLLHRIMNEKNNYLVVRYERTLEIRKGFTSDLDALHRYTGTPDKFYLRYRVTRSNDFSMGLTAEQDPGEPITWRPYSQQFGIDFLSGHIQILRKGLIDNLILGDFQCQFGQGLQLGSLFGMGKNAEVISSIRRSNLGFLPYTSVSENLYMRGAAASIRLTNQIRIHGFFSSKRIDAITEIEEPRISSLSYSGLHRTAREMEAQKQVTDQDTGLMLQFHSGVTDAGILMHQKTRDHELTPAENPYNHFAFKGRSHQNLGFYFNTSWANMTFFGEAGHTLGHGCGITCGVLGNLSNKLEMAWLYRHFAPDFYADYANAFSESSTPQNEWGLYWGLRYTFNRRLTWSGYIDLFQFPWLRYRTYHPSDGSEWLVRIEYKPSRTAAIFLQAREEIKDRNLTAESFLYSTGVGTKSNFWLGCEVGRAQGLSLKSRIQASQYSLGGATTRGIACVQDVVYTRPRWSVALRYALFDTDDYENRLYISERDVWLTASLPAYEGIGLRNYVLFHGKISSALDIWVRWSRTAYQDRSTIGSGGDQINGNTRNDVKFQFRIRF